MSHRPVTTTTATSAVLLAAATLLTACGGSGSAASGSSTTTTPVKPTTSVMPTTPVTSTPTTPATTLPVPTLPVPTLPVPTLPVPTLSKPGKPNTTMTPPPPAKDTLLIPDNPRDYGQAFVIAWVNRDRTRAAQLGTAAAVSTAFGSTVRTAPAFQACEGAAGSSYCTWEGDEYTMTLRLLSERASQRQDHAVAEVRFAH